MAASSSRPRVVIVGGGFGGITACHHLADAPVDVTLIDRHNYHTFQPLLYQVATAGLDASDVAYPLRKVIRRQRNADVRMEAVVAADPEKRTVTFEDGRTLEYDYLVVGGGAETNYFGVPGAAERALPMKTLPHAIAIRNHVLRAFEACANDPTKIDEGWLNIVIVGGGPTGVELAGGMAELLDVLRRDYHHLATEVAAVHLIEGSDALLGPYSPKSQQYAKRTLEQHGVRVRLGLHVSQVDEDEVHLSDGTTLGTRTVIWAGGVQAQSVAGQLGLAQTRGARVEVGADLRVTDHPEVFVIGDMGAAPQKDGTPYPQLAQPAIQQGRHAAHQIRHLLAGRPTRPFHYLDKGVMATIGRNRAVCELPNGWRLQGFVAWLAWLGLHLLYLTGFRNRMNVVVNWAWGYVTYDRGIRLITDEPLEPVEAVEATPVPSSA